MSMTELFTPEQQAYINQQAQLALSGGSGGTLASPPSTSTTGSPTVSGSTLISLPNGAAVPVSTLAQNGVPGYTQLPGGGFSAPSDAYVVGFGGSTYQIGQHPEWFPTAGAGGRVPTQAENPANAANASSADLLLKQYGLDQLVPIVDQWIRGGMSWEEAQLALYDRSTQAGKIFDTRFPAIAMRQAKGLPPITPADYVNYEKTATEYLRAAGLPQGFYDQHDDFTNLISNDVSLNELNTRVTAGYAAVASAPPEVRSAFQQFFGAQGDSALAAYFLDPSKALPALEKQVNIAQIGGTGMQAGFNLGLDRTSQIADTGVSDAQARSAFDSVHQLDPLFQNTISEKGSLTAANQGIDAAFSLDQGQAKADIQGRLDQRKADFAGGGGAAAGQQGVFGLGTAR